MGDRYANPFAAPRTHFAIESTSLVPLVGLAPTIHIACGRRGVPRHKQTTDKKHVSCLSCIDAIKRKGL